MNRVVIITGVTSGIGEKLKEIFLNSGDTVLGLSRSVKPDEHNFVLDVADKTSVEKTFSEIGKNFPKIDILINCAGFGLFGAAELLTEDEIKKQFDVNVFGLLWCTQA